MSYDVIISELDGTIIKSGMFRGFKAAKKWAAGNSNCIIYIYKDDQLYKKYFGRRKRKEVK